MLKKLKSFFSFCSTDQIIADINRSINLHKAEIEDLETELRHYEKIKLKQNHHEKRVSNFSL